MSFYVAARPSGEPPVHPVNEVLPPTKLGIYGAQHVLAFYAGAVIVPILLAGAIGLRGEDLLYLISADLFTCGIASIIQAIGFRNIGVRLPLLQGVTFTAVAPLAAFERRLDNTPVQEQMAALVEIAKIANLRLFDLVGDDVPEPAAAPAGA
jgi:xanthine/uracil permease